VRQNGRGLAANAAWSANLRALPRAWEQQGPPRDELLVHPSGACGARRMPVAEVLQPMSQRGVPVVHGALTV